MTYRPNRRSCLPSMMLCAALGFAESAFSVPVEFSASVVDYGTSSNSSNVYGDTDIAAVSYFVGSGAGKAGAAYAGNLMVYHNDRVPSQRFDIFMSWVGSNFTGSSTFEAGARATVWAAGHDWNVLDKSASINTSISGGAPGNLISVGGPDCIDFDALNILFVVSAGGSLCLDQTVHWNLGAITGTLEARLGAYEILTPFSFGAGIATGAPRFARVPLDLPSYGDWAFSVKELLVSGTMDSDVNVDLCAVVDIPFFNPFQFGCSAVSAYSTPPKTLAFSDAKPDVRFRVFVPEPASFPLVGLGLVGLALYRRRNREPVQRLS